MNEADILVRCGLCGRCLPEAKFPLTKHGVRYRLCSACVEQEDAWRRAVAPVCERGRVSYDQYMALWRRQRGVCALCGRDGRQARLSVDRRAEDGEIRGLLCRMCMKMVPQRDEMRWLSKITSYLQSRRSSRWMEFLKSLDTTR